MTIEPSPHPDYASVIGTALTELSQEPGTQYAVLWEDEDDGVGFGIPTPEQIAKPTHKRICEITIRFH